MKAILDTSVVIATDLQPLEGALAVSAITMAELHFGVLVAKTQPVRAERLRRLLKLPLSHHPAPLAPAPPARTAPPPAAVRPGGRRPRARAMDLLIAATAHAHSARLYTRNAVDLQGLESLIDITPV